MPVLRDTVYITLGNLIKSHPTLVASIVAHLNGEPMNATLKAALVVGKLMEPDSAKMPDQIRGVLECCFEGSGGSVHLVYPKTVRVVLK